MVKQIKYTSEDAYKIEKENNERKFVEMIKLVRPDLYVLMDVLDETGVNSFVIVKLIRQLALISRETGGSNWGKITCEINDGRVLWVRGEENNRLDEPLLVTKKLTP